MQAAERLERGDSVEAVAEAFRVTVPTVRAWRRRWRDGGVEALRSRGPVSVERSSAAQWTRLEWELRRGPAVHGFTDDQRWMRTLIGRLIHVDYTVQGCGSG